MLNFLIRFSLAQRFLILFAGVALCFAGVWAFRDLPIDAFPDISSPQVQVIITAPGMSPREVESRITFPIELEMQGLPRQTVLRSTTKYALSSITLDFADGTDIYWARAQVAERLNQVWGELPPGISGGLAPITTPLGEIFMYRIVGKGYTNQDLRSLQDWVIRPRLRTVDGVADINSLGGEVRAFEVIAQPEALAAYDLNLTDLEEALERNNRNAGGDRINRNDEILLVRTLGSLRNEEDIRHITVATRNGTPIHVRDVAEVRIGALTRYGAVTADGQGEAVTGLALLRKGANARQTVAGLKNALAGLQATLPQGVRIVPFYDRSELIVAAIDTVKQALSEAVLLVLVVLVIMLGNLRAAFTVALILPLSVLFTFLAMRLLGISANLMSLGGLAIAIGILVDAAVVVVENIHNRLNHAPTGSERSQLAYEATREVAAPVTAGILIIITVFLPLFSLTGLEGKMFTPLAVTIALALGGSLLLALTIIPVLASFLMRPGRHETRVLSWLQARYLPLVRWALRQRALTTGLAIAALAGAGLLFTQIGKEFMPVLDEGTTVLIIEKLPSISLERSLALDAPLQKAIMELPEVTGVVSRTGADELRMDPMGLHQTDYFLTTKPREQWTATLEDFHARLRAVLDRFIGLEYSFTQPIDMRASEMLTGVRADMAIRLYGTDLAVLEEQGKRIEALVNRVPGASDVFRPPLTGQIYLEIAIRPAAGARFGINAEDINRLIETAVGGRIVSEIVAGDRRTAVLLRYPEAARSTPEAIGALRVSAADGQKIPLSALADIRTADGPVAIPREGARRVAMVQANVTGRDVVSFVAEVRTLLTRELRLPAGYYLTYGGQFENQQRAAERLSLVVPISVLLIFVMLFSTFRSLRHAVLILLNIPFALIGGVVALYLSGLYLSVPASVGFITLFGVAVLNGVVMVSHFNELRAAGHDIVRAVEEGAVRRLRPVLMTALIAALGLTPLLTADGPGAELQRPLAVVVIGGLVTSTLLTLILLPALYAWVEERVGRHRGRAAQPL